MLSGNLPAWHGYPLIVNEEDDLWMRMVAAKVSNKQSRTAERGWFLREDYRRFLTLLTIKFDKLRNNLMFFFTVHHKLTIY